MKRSAEKKCVSPICMQPWTNDGHLTCTRQAMRLTCRKVDALYECCNAFYKEQGEEATTTSCPKYSLLKYDSAFYIGKRSDSRRLKMKQRAQTS